MKWYEYNVTDRSGRTRLYIGPLDVSEAAAKECGCEIFPDRAAAEAARPDAVIDRLHAARAAAERFCDAAWKAADCRCPLCGCQTTGTREGDTEYCTSCGAVLVPAWTKETEATPTPTSPR